MPVFRLSKEELIFPAPALAEDNGLLAVGGDLCVDRLLLAYSHGIFPWYNPGEEILWWCPRERFLIFPGKIHVSHSMKKYMRKHDFQVLLNRDFQDTMHHCRMKREGVEGTWISDDMEAAYLKLHKAGFAVSVEVYEDGILSGGLYGVAIGRCFFGESMFSEKANGSKAALIIFSYGPFGAYGRRVCAMGEIRRSSPRGNRILASGQSVGGRDSIRVLTNFRQTAIFYT